MFRKSNFPLVFNVFLAFFLSAVLTLFIKATSGALTLEQYIIGLIQSFCVNLTLEELIDLPKLGNRFVQLLGIRNIEGKAAYFTRILAIVFVMMLLMSFILMFCEIGFSLGLQFFLVWITKVPAIFLVAYITAVIFFVPSMKMTQALCVKAG